MKESFEQVPIIPETTLEIMYLEQGVKVQKALNKAFLKARDRKLMLGMKDPEKEPFFITKEDIQKLKDQYDKEFKKLQELQELISPELQKKFSKLETQEEWEEKLEEWEEKTKELGRDQMNQTQKFIRKPAEEIGELVDPQTESGWNKLHPDDQVEKMTDYLEKKKESEESEELEKAA